MQIIIDLYQSEEGTHHFGEDQLARFNCFETAKLLMRLKEEGYRVNALYGRLIYDLADNVVIDCGEPGSDIPMQHLFDAACQIYRGKGKLLVIFVEQKYCLFTDRYFVAFHFCHFRKVHPLSPYQALRNFDGLILKNDQRLLNQLYLDSFVFRHGDIEAVPTLFDPNGKPRPAERNGFAVPAPGPSEATLPKGDTSKRA